MGVATGQRGASPLPEITALTPSTRRAGRVHLHLDGRYAASLDALTVATHHLRVGQVLTPEAVAALEREAVIARLVDRALRFLGFRPRSEAELRTYLRRHEATPEQTDAVVAELRRIGLVDDAAFARFWRGARDRAAPRGERLLRAELRAKGVAADEVAAVLPGAEEEAALARQAAERPLRTARALPWPEFRAKLLGYLQRRGFSYETASRTVRDLWEELTNERPDAEDA